MYVGCAILDDELSVFEQTTGSTCSGELLQAACDTDLARQNRRLLNDNSLLKDQLRQAEDVANGLVQTIEMLERDRVQ